MVIFKLLLLSYMPTTIYFSYDHTNGIAMLRSNIYSCSGAIYMKEMKIKQNSVEFQN